MRFNITNYNSSKCIKRSSSVNSNNKRSMFTQQSGWSPNFNKGREWPMMSWKCITKPVMTKMLDSEGPSINTTKTTMYLSNLHKTDMGDWMDPMSYSRNGRQHTIESHHQIKTTSIDIRSDLLPLGRRDRERARSRTLSAFTRGGKRTVWPF